MTNLYPKNIEKLVHAVLTSEGDSTQDTRQAIEAYVAKQVGANRDAEGVIMDDLVSYVDKISKHAYKMTDKDVAELKAKGYSEDEIFEITVSAALGAGLARVEHSLNLLNQTQEGV